MTMKGAEIGEGLVDYLTEVFDLAADKTHKLSAWEQDFVTDVKTRFEAYGSTFRCSEKQWEIIKRIGDKVGAKL